MQVTWCQSSLEEVFREVSLDDDGCSNEKTDTETEEEEEEDHGDVRKGRKRSWSKSPTRAFVKNFP